MPASPAGYELAVFINCPFDPEYRPLFRALVFTVSECGLKARCALEIDDAGDTRIDKIQRLIEGCRYGIHDLSRTELDTANRLPRFNMPLELGLFLGARRYGNRQQKSKICLVLDVEPHRYQRFCSDIAGQDIRSHQNRVDLAIRAVRDWLATRAAAMLPGQATIAARYQRFSSELPTMAAAAGLDADTLIFGDYAKFVSIWLSENAAGNGAA